MSALNITSVGFDRCYKCKKVKDGGWVGQGKMAGKSCWFMCLRCILNELRKFIRLKRKYSSEP